MSSRITVEYPNILVVSNNSFSTTTNNGKTLASFFKGYPNTHIAQLYFYPELPDDDSYNNFFRITDKDVVRAFLKNQDICGSPVLYDVSSKIRNNKTSNQLLRQLKKYNFVRILREFLWKSNKWKTDIFLQWVREFSPEIILFCAGDSGFAYDVVQYIQKICDSKKIIYITDDYILPRRTISPFWWLRRNYIFNKMKTSIKNCELLVTISEEMRGQYYRIFNKDSILAINMTESMKMYNSPQNSNDAINFVYAGGLHYKRYLTLNLLAQAIKRYNNNPEKKKKLYLRVYSGERPSDSIMKYLTIDGASGFHGSLNPQELKKVLNDYEIPLHVESFDKKSIESTKLSISTKIPEYLSLGKPILAIGPKEVASMQYLQDCAFCITDKNCIEEKLQDFLHNEELFNYLSNKAIEKYELNHNPEKQSKDFIKNIISRCIKD